jgi:hypothetical protein
MTAPPLRVAPLAVAVERGAGCHLDSRPCEPGDYAARKRPLSTIVSSDQALPRGGRDRTCWDLLFP